jgi:hypothetical protein
VDRYMTSLGVQFIYIWKIEQRKGYIIQGPFTKFVDWRQCATVVQREAVTYANL